MQKKIHHRSTLDHANYFHSSSSLLVFVHMLPALQSGYAAIIQPLL